MTAEVTSDVVADLAEAGVATVYEAQGGFGALPAGILPLVEGWRACGPARCVAVAPGDNLWIHRAVARAEPGEILVVVTGGGHEHGYWGDVLAHAAAARGLAGLVIDGGVRDVDALRRLGRPVFSRPRCIVGTTKDPSLPGGMPPSVRLGATDVTTGDLVVADDDGVVVVRRDRAAEVARAAQRRAADEDGYLRRLEDGETTLDIYALPS